MNIKRYYNEVVTGNKYDLEKASNHINEMYYAEAKAEDVPSIASTFVAQNHVGCCLHYGMTLFKMLRENSIECYIAITKEENPVTHQKTDNHVSVCYVKDGERFIADPVETIKLGKGDYSAIPINTFKKEQGTIELYDPYGEYGKELFFVDFLSHPIEILIGD